MINRLSKPYHVQSETPGSSAPPSKTPCSSPAFPSSGNHLATTQSLKPESQESPLTYRIPLLRTQADLTPGLELVRGLRVLLSMAANKDIMTSLFAGKKASMGQKISSLAAQLPMSGLPPSWIALVIKAQEIPYPQKGHGQASMGGKRKLLLSYICE